MKKFYLALSVLGAIVPYVFFVRFLQAEGVNLSGFFSGLFVNGAAGGFSADLLISSLVFWIFMFRESLWGESPSPYLFIVLNLTVGLSCALPAYLYARESTRKT